ncbi:hypothetical protein N431DRAFT_404605 [Stipitochalara longipes BDJ]|nr:hypothetical protein N431DRAFT_404605 [Stipitochalara longipes BDJ]
MVTITKLPAELLQQALQNFEDDKATLGRLSLVSSLFASVAQQLLLRHLVLSVDTPLDGVETSFDKIIRLLDEKPQLSTHVQTLTIFSRHAWTQSLDSINRVFNLLDRVTSLRSLDLDHELMLPDDETHLFNSIIEANRLARLTKLRLRNPFIKGNVFTELLYLPKLKYLALDHLLPPLAIFLSSLDRVCSLRTLEIGYWRGQPDLVLKNLLETTVGLEELVLRMQPEEYIESICIPSEVSQAMTPLQDTLKVLTITGPAFSPLPDTSRLDLSSFRVLEKVNVVSSFLFPPPEVAESRVGLYTLLPRSLLDLQINFLPEDRISISSVAAPSVIEDWQTTWLWELAVNKAAYFPNLRTVVLQEWHGLWTSNRLDYFDETDCHQMEVSEDLKMELKRNSIAIQCWARKGSDGR